MTVTFSPSRRRLLVSGLAATALPALPRAAGARAEDVDYAVRQDFGPIDPAEGMVHLDMPRHSDAGTSVPLTLTVDSPMTAADHPATVRLYASENPRPRVVTVHFTPLCGRAEFSTRIRLDGAQDVSAIALTSAGQAWRTAERVGVTFGACATAGDSSGLPPDWAPSAKVSLPATAAAGEIVPVRTLITHPMETGLRLDARNAYVPLRIIETFACRVDGTPAFSARLEPALATNPYLAFTLRFEASATVDFEWTDTTGAVYTRSAAITVS